MNKISSKAANDLNIAREKLNSGDYLSCIKIIQKCLNENPQSDEALFLLAELNHKQGNDSEAIKFANIAFRINPQSQKALLLLAELFFNNKNYQQANIAAQELVKLAPDHQRANWLASYCLFKTDKINFAKSFIEKCLEQDSKALAINLMQAIYCLDVTNQVSKAIEYIQREIDLRPDYASSYLVLARAYGLQGKINKAIEACKKAIQLNPNSQVSHDNLIMYMHYSPDIKAQQILTTAKNYQKTFYGDLKNMSLPRQALKGNKFKLGFVSGDLKDHAIYYWIKDLFKELKDDLDLYCYCNNPEDQASQELKSLTKSWLNIQDLSDDKVQEEIKNDGINILIDLSGHTAKNRLGVFEKRSAPVQLTWIGQDGPTGLLNMDYVLSDIHHCNKLKDKHYSEKILCLENTFAPLSLPCEKEISVQEAPYKKNGFISFGVYNNFLKVNYKAIETYSEILKQVPASKLIIKARLSSDENSRLELEKEFAKLGVEKASIIWQEHDLNKEAYLASYNQVDIALDSFPIGGGTTTIDTLWMSTPVISLWGKRVSHRTSSVFIQQTGAKELVAHSYQEYIEKAVNLAQDTARIDEYKKTLREKLLRSKLFDLKSFKNDFLKLLNQVWGEENK